MYKEVTLAFMASFELSFSSIHSGTHNEVTFFAHGKYHTMSIIEFIKGMGTYTNEEIDSPKFHALPIDLPRGVVLNTFWREILMELTFRPCKSRGSSFRMLSHRVLHYILVRSMNPRLESSGVVAEIDMLPLYSIINQYKVNVGVILTFAFRHQASDSG